MSLRFYYGKSQMSAQIDLSSLNSFESLKIVIKNKFSLPLSTDDIGFTKHEADPRHQFTFFLDFDTMLKLSEDKIINIVQSPYSLIKELKLAINENSPYEIEKCMKNIRPFIKDQMLVQEMISQDIVPFLFDLIRIKGINLLSINIAWNMIRVVLANHDYCFEQEQRAIICKTYNADMDNYNYAFIFRAIFDQLKEEELFTYLPEFKDFELLPVGIENIDSVSVNTSILNIVIVKKFEKKEVPSFNIINNKFYQSAINVLEKAVVQDSSDIPREKIIFLAENIYEAQKIFLDLKFYKDCHDKKKPDSSEVKHICSEIRKRCENIIEKNSLSTSLMRDLTDSGNIEKYINTDGMGLLFGNSLLTIFDVKTNKIPLGQLFFTYNNSVDTSKKLFPIIESTVNTINIISNILDELSSDNSVYRGVLKPLFFESDPIIEYFKLALEIFFINWKEMNGSLETLQNISNFTKYQFNEILKLHSCRKQTSFGGLKSYVPTYSSKIHTWLKLDVKSIISEPINLPKELLGPLSKNLKSHIVSRICESRIAYLQEQKIMMEEVLKSKDKKHIYFGLDQYYNFTYANNLSPTKHSTTELETLKPSDFIGIQIGNISDTIKKRINEQILKKVDKHTVYIIFKAKIFIVRQSGTSTKELDILDDCLNHLSGNIPKSVLFRDQFARLYYIAIKTQLLEYDSLSEKKLTKPIIPSNPPEMIQQSNLKIDG